MDPVTLANFTSAFGSCRSTDDVEDALCILETSPLSQSQVERALRQLQDVTEPSRLMELVLCFSPWSGAMSTWLLKSFPLSVDKYLDSIHREVVERLSLLLTFVPHPFGREVDHTIFELRARVELAPKVIQLLLAMSFDKEGAGVDEQEDLEFDGLLVGKKRKQSERKQARKAKKPTSRFNPKDLERLGISEPQSRLEAYTTANLLVECEKDTLQQYLDFIYDERITAAVQNMFVVQSPMDVAEGNEHVAEGSPTEVVVAAEDSVVPSAYPCVQPMKAALYFESASGFGEWRILISTRADRDLREARRSDQKFFKIVLKKIIELSNGHFSDDNQKRLTQPNVDFPVFEAKMTRDSRLVYQIDCIPEYDNNFERQVIKIFGVYTHAQIDKRFWDSMGHQLSRKGNEYRKRCKFRNRPQVEGDNVILPASFPPPEKEVQDTSIVPELPKEDLEEIHSLLVLEKFVTLSKELLATIVVDLDVAHVFDVTRQEKEIIEHPHSCYVLGRSGTGKTTTMLFKMLGIERAYTQQSETSAVAKPRQVFVTQSRVLASRVEEYFEKLLSSLAAAQKSKDELKRIADEKKLQQEETNLLYDVDDDVTWKAGLPEKFSLLQDEHFPLFLTFERLSQLLENDIKDSSYTQVQPDTDRKGGMVTYEVFFEKYWPHFPQDLTKNLDPALVYSELLGVIEGSEQSLSHEMRYLDQETYRNLSHRVQHVFAKQRDRVYALFLAYLKRKRQNGDFDTADRTHRILKGFETSGVPGTKIDYLYVDEAQDNLLIDAMLLRSMCRNPNGLFWAGDTAQTIALGSSFRFNDLKAFLYRLEERRESKLIDSSGITQSELRTFQLLVNYRSHGGIVRCATAVIELITHFWPYAIDSLAPEKGIVDGAKPVFFSGWDTDTVRYEQFLFGDSGERIEFGARQCILVRDDAARTELRQQVGDIGLILTLYESKGLEFDDVLLYKFFEDSKVDLGQWRLVLNMVEKSKCNGVAAPRFDEERHAGICSELKFLYVAITRARKNLWIVDCSDKAVPMKTLWESNGYIQNCKPGGEVPRLAVSSTPEEWANTGRALFTNRRYLQAMHAFERAGLARESKIAHTHYLREIARQIQPTNKENTRARREAFCAAASSFLECARSAKGKEQRVFFHNAGDCYEHAGSCGDKSEDYGNAAKAYEAAKEYTPAVKLYRKGDLFDDAVNVVQKHRHEVDDELAESVLEVARLYYFKNKDFAKAKTLFDTVEEQLEYLEDNILLDDCHAAVLADLGRYQEAADIHIEEGRTMDAIRVLLEDKENRESIRRANDYILRGLWQNNSFSQKIKDSDTDALALLELASKLDASLLSPTQKAEISMFRNLRTNANDSATFRKLAYEFLKRDEKYQALLCFDHHFLRFHPGTNITNSVLAGILEDFLAFCRLFREVALTLDLANPSIQQLFSFQPASVENAYRLRHETWIYRQTLASKVLPLESDEESIVVSASDLERSLRLGLRTRLRQRLNEENEFCHHRIGVFTLCLPFIMNNECRRTNCSRQHIDYMELTQAWYNAQLRIHCLQILIYHIYHATSPSPHVTIPERRYWIHRLYETLRPPAHYMGSQASVRLTAVAEAPAAFEAVKNWSRDILYTRDVKADRELLSFHHEAAVLCLLIDQENARNYLPRAPLLVTLDKQPAFHRPINAFGGKQYILLDLFHCLNANEKTFTSAGILFLEHVVNLRIPIDVNDLCHLVEFLSGSIILARLGFNLHNITLPRGWILLLLRQISVREADHVYLDRLLHSMKALLESLVNGGELARYLLFENRDLSDLPQVRELFISRICRAIGLIGYNISNYVVRDKILDILKVVNAAKPHYSFSAFMTKTKSWGQVARAVQQSYIESHMDDMVQLCLLQKKHDKQWPAPKGVRRVFFSKLEDVPTILSTGPMRADAAPFVPKGLAKAGAGASVAVDENEESVEQTIEQPDADAAGLVDSRDLVDTLATTAAPLAVEKISDGQKAIAARLTARYRRVLRTRKLERAKTSTQKAYDSFFDTCLKASKDMAWPHGFFYRKLYLGLVPHLLACVNGVESYAHSAKAKAKKRLRKDEKQDLEGLNKRITELSFIFKSSKSLHKALEPSSKLHKQRDIEQLKKLVGEVEALVKRVPPGSGLDVQFNLDMAIKGIVTEKKVPEPEPKPELNVDDVGGAEDYVIPVRYAVN
ncbi:hypothetical protein DFP72DRAFT_996790 [Ephemerocybe angulata]|uniref:UvrD-like helicase ATP-binding domain-containing protein n=1 Tax=Ephemerocybe angulata TaxID=980116 RepID=A0A8H6MHQ0_9AGAR|nr:hypothetical protein DFP72DRAFT_996790 [Tulosesus angulatus]